MGCKATAVPLLAGLLAAGAAAAAVPTYPDLAPLFREHCVMCHAGEGAPLGLRLDTLENLARGGVNGPVAVPGRPQESELLRRLRGESLPRMPLTGPPYLADAEIARVEAWIAGGMQPGPTHTGAAAPGPVAEETPPPPGTWAAAERVFLQRCVTCHADGAAAPPPEGRRLATRAQVLDARERAVVVPGAPGASELVRRVRGQARPRMPLDGPPFLSPGELAALEAWVAAGAPDAAGVSAPVPAGARVRLHGTLDGPRRLDGLPLELAPGARVRAAPGQYVRVKGTVTSGGGVRADEVRGRGRGDRRRGKNLSR